MGEKFTKQVIFSMDGFRRTMHTEIQTLKDYLEEQIKGNYVDDHCIKVAMDAVIASSNSLNHVYVELDKNFSDMGHLHITTFEEDKARDSDNG